VVVASRTDRTPTMPAMRLKSFGGV